jgi:hypothetical protein
MTTSITPASPSPPPVAAFDNAPHKRRPPAGPAFVLPSYACFACFDSGIVANHDLAINEFLADYDVLPSGERMVGSDPAVICCCTAAYSGTGRGFRDSSGPCRVETAVGARLIGCELPQEAIATIHRNRRQLAYAAVQITAEQARLQKASQQAIAGLLPSLGREEI